MIGEAPRSYLTGVPGWETVSEQAKLVNLAQKVPASGLIVEIGAEYGMSASLFVYAILGIAPHPRIVSVDLFPEKMLEHHRYNLQMAGFAHHTEQIQGDSSFVGNNWFDPIDLLFIDGDHTYPGVTADLDAWIRHVKPGGVVVFHDVAQDTNHNPHPQHYEVAAALRDWLTAHPKVLNVVERVDSMLVMEKTG